jgi:hypothetical protein
MSGEQHGGSLARVWIVRRPSRRCRVLGQSVDKADADRGTGVAVRILTSSEKKTGVSSSEQESVLGCDCGLGRPIETAGSVALSALRNNTSFAVEPSSRCALLVPLSLGILAR